MLTFTLTPISENALLVAFLDDGQAQPSAALAHTIARCSERLLSEHPNAVTDCVGAFLTLVVHYNILAITPTALRCIVQHTLKQILAEPDRDSSSRPVVEIPVYYSCDTGPDLSRLAAAAALTIDEVAARHCQASYTAYAVGFAPGFAYLGFVDPQLCCSRLATPRAVVPAGSVGIADRQTGVYPTASPGGWNIIGRTPLAMLIPPPNEHPRQLPSSRITSGDSVRFRAIGRDEFIALGGTIN